MVQGILNDVLIFGSAIILALLIDFRKSVRFWHFLLLFFVIGLADNLLHTVTEIYPDIQIIKSDIWNNYLYCNWSAKIYSVAFSMILFLPIRNIITREEIGLTFRQNQKSIRFSLIFILFFFVSALIVSSLGQKGSFDLKVLLFLAIMPGLNEELIYRGFLLGFLNKIFGKRFRILKTDFGWGTIITSVVFGLLHGLSISNDYQIELNNLPNVILTSLYGFIFALMKERSGSLVFPVIAHSTIDFFHFLFRMI